MNAIITGASKGIGYYTAVELAQRGCNLLLLSRDTDGLQQLVNECRKNSAAAVSFKKFDLTEFDDFFPDVERFIHHTFEGELDILINNAGALTHKAFKDFTENDIQRLVQVNFIAPARFIQAVVPYLENTVKSHVVNISSMGGYQGSVKFPGLSFYSATKGALNTLTEVLSEEYRNTQVSFNALALGAVQTEMLDEAFPGMEAPLSAHQMGQYVADFALNGHNYFNGKVLPVSLSTP